MKHLFGKCFSIFPNKQVADMSENNNEHAQKDANYYVFHSMNCLQNVTMHSAHLQGSVFLCLTLC